MEKERERAGDAPQTEVGISAELAEIRTELKRAYEHFLAAGRKLRDLEDREREKERKRKEPKEKERKRENVVQEEKEKATTSPKRKRNGERPQPRLVDLGKEDSVEDEVLDFFHNDPLGPPLIPFVRRAEERNKTKTIAASRVLRSFIRPVQDTARKTSREAMRYGLDVAAEEGKTENMRYAMAVARNNPLGPEKGKNGQKPTKARTEEFD
jgi:hypothetical protein